jgi:NTE family protein
LAVVATATATSRSTVFVEKRRDLELPDRDDRKGIDYEEPNTGITARHLMASASVPMLFAPVNLGSDGPRWFVDDGVRLNTPIKPAISLGADKVVIVATNPACHLPPEEPPRQKTPDLDDTFLQFMQAAIADPLIEDVYRLARTNTLVAVHNADKELESDWEGIWIEDEQRSIEPIPYLFVGPTERGVFGERAAEVVKRINASENSLIDLLVGTRRISQLLGTQGTRQKELLSYVLFDPMFASEAIELGREHAYQELHELDGLNRDWRIGPIDCGTPATGAKESHMAGSGELYQRHDGKWAWLIKATNGQIVATDGGQGYEAKTDALSTLQKVISGHYHGLIKELD